MYFFLPNPANDCNLVDWAQDSTENSPPTRGSHSIVSIHTCRHSLYPYEHYNPIRNTLRDTENEFPNIPRKEEMLPKGCLCAQSWVWMEHFQNCDAHENADFRSWWPSVKALQRNLWSETSVACHSPANRPCHLCIYLVMTTLFAVVGISRSSVSAPSARLCS